MLFLVWLARCQWPRIVLGAVLSTAVGELTSVYGYAAVLALPV